MQSRLWTVAVCVLVAGALTIYLRCRLTEVPAPMQDAREEATRGHEDAPLAVVAEDGSSGANASMASSEPLRVAAVAPRSEPRALLSDAERVVSRADALAGDLQLQEADRLALVSVLLAEQERRAAALASWRRRPRTEESSSRLRSALDAIRVWKASALSARFGLAKADRILQRHQPGGR